MSSARKHRPDEALVDTRMRRLYDTLEPTVISFKLLNHTIYEQGPRDEAGKIAKQEGIKYNKVKSLRLDFKNILHITNLNQFSNLTHLQLVHNIIQKIANLDSLVNLQWLDLSFNRISQIEGLDSLVNLSDLSLFHNEIEIVENLDNLVLLNVFSIGKNKINHLDNVLYLRRFKNLRSLNLAGNPICVSNDYFATIFAFFPDLLFLDYRLVTKAEHQESYERFMIAVEQLNEKEQEENKAKQEKNSLAQAMEVHRSAFVEYLDTDVLFTEIIDLDPDKTKILGISGAEELIISFKDRFMPICKELFQKGLDELHRRQRDLRIFYKVINAAKNENGQRAKDLINEFNIHKESVFREYNKTNIVDDETWKILKEKTYTLWNELMNLEVQLFDQLEDTIRSYCRNLTEMTENFLTIVNNYFTQLRESEAVHSERLSENAMLIFERVTKNDFREEKLKQLKSFDIFHDRELLVNTLLTSHDYRLLKLDMWEDKIRKSANDWLDKMKQEITEAEEQDRNRNRILEINSFIDNVRGEIENYEIPGVILN